ncbi:MAG: hypothetical protein K8F25_01185, partial [Fimbriimonadaceae bacterium]|nr:hypothetical protein [Alphaproteobacteria bacterium]
YYDRTLAQLHQTGKIISVGLAYAAQYVTYVPREAHDIPLDWILTEDGPNRVELRDKRCGKEQNR